MIKAIFSIQDSQSIHAVSLHESDSMQIEWEIDGSCSPLLQKQIALWIEQYESGNQPTVTLPLAARQVSPYTKKVLQELTKIPFGAKITYKQLAELSGNPSGSRAAGNACGRNPWPLIIPCHRVVGQKGLGGFSSGGVSVKERLIAFELLKL